MFVIALTLHLESDIFISLGDLIVTYLKGEIVMKKMRKLRPLYGLFGFFGCFGCRYFISHDVGDLFYFSFFAYFGFFLIGKLSQEMPDERFYANSRKAGYQAGRIAALALFLAGFSTTLPWAGKEITVILCALGWTAYMLVYSMLFYYYERRC